MATRGASAGGPEIRDAIDITEARLSGSISQKSETNVEALRNSTTAALDRTSRSVTVKGRLRVVVAVRYDYETDAFVEVDDVRPLFRAGEWDGRGPRFGLAAGAG
jgi:hypothetical protein